MWSMRFVVYQGWIWKQSDPVTSQPVSERLFFSVGEDGALGGGGSLGKSDFKCHIS